MGKFNFAFKGILWRVLRFELATQTHVLPSTPFAKVLVCWATGKWLTNRLPKLNLITVYVQYRTPIILLLIWSETGKLVEAGFLIREWVLH